MLASGARFGAVLADAEYGKAAEFRAGLAERRLAYAVGILPAQKVYPADVTLAFPERKPTGRPRKHPVPSAASVGAAELIESRPAAFRAVSWRTGTKGPLEAEFAALRVRVADGPVAARRPAPARRGGVAGRRAPGHRRAQVLPLEPAGRRPLEALAALIKARWVCEQLHQQLKDELGLDHFEGRSWRGLHHHALLCLLAFAFLQHLRLGGKKRRHRARARTAAPAEPARRPPSGSWPRSPACSSAARTVGGASSTTSGSEGGRVVLEPPGDPDPGLAGGPLLGVALQRDAAVHREPLAQAEARPERQVDRPGGFRQAGPVPRGCRRGARPRVPGEVPRVGQAGPQPEARPPAQPHRLERRVEADRAQRPGRGRASPSPPWAR